MFVTLWKREIEIPSFPRMCVRIVRIVCRAATTWFTIVSTPTKANKHSTLGCLSKQTTNKQTKEVFQYSANRLFQSVAKIRDNWFLVSIANSFLFGDRRNQQKILFYTFVIWQMKMSSLSFSEIPDWPGMCGLWLPECQDLLDEGHSPHSHSPPQSPPDPPPHPDHHLYHLHDFRREASNSQKGSPLTTKEKQPK